MKIAVLGCGIIGASTAWWLNQAGHDVVVVDRASGAACETTRGSGGHLSVSGAEPWASPVAPRAILRAAFLEGGLSQFRPATDPSQWSWILSFLAECRRERLVPNVRAMVQLAEYSRSIQHDMAIELDMDYCGESAGILNFYRDHDSFEASQEVAGAMRDFGVDRRVLTPDEIIALEPALASVRPRLVGGDYTADDETGDAHAFTAELVRRSESAGVQFRFATTVTRLLPGDGRIRSAEIIDAEGLYGELRADAYVVALGSDAPGLVRPVGIPCRVIPAKGYSATFDIVEPDAAPRVGLHDRSRKVMIARLGDRLRVAGATEFAGHDRSLNARRCQDLFTLARELFPSVLDFGNVSYWSGLRPLTPSGVPLVGRTRIPNLYLNTGHGPLGWTMGPGSGRALADIIGGRRPELEFPFLGLTHLCS